MKRVVITGATSMIGVVLVEECIRNEIEGIGDCKKEIFTSCKTATFKFIKSARM